MTDIAEADDVVVLLRAFYGRCFADDLLGPVFVDVAHLDLESHLPIMVDFWMTVLFRTGHYDRNLLKVHADLHERAPLTPQLLDRWLSLWTQTSRELYTGEVVERAITQAERITWSLARRLNGESASQLTTVIRGDLVKPFPAAENPSTSCRVSTCQVMP